MAELVKAIDCKSININVDHGRILTAQATEPEKAASAEYKDFANAYLKTMTNLETANSIQLTSIYDNMVNDCMACHKSMCPGPLTRIETLQVALD